MGIVDSIKNEYINKRYSEAYKGIKDIQDDIQYMSEPNCIEDYPRYIKALIMVKESIPPITLTMDIKDIKDNVEEYYSKEYNDWIQQEVDINESFDKKISDKIAELEDEAKKHNEEVTAEFNASNKKYIDLENKRRQLEKYKDEVIDICSAYGITTADVDIDNSSFTIAELNDVYDQYLKYLNNRKMRTNPIREFRRFCPDKMVQGGVILAIILLLFSPLLDILAVAFFTSIIIAQMKAKSKMKSYIVLLGLVFNVRPLQMGFKGEIDKSKLVDETVDEDKDSRLDTLAEEWQKQLDALEEEDPRYDLEEARVTLTNSACDIEEEIRCKLTEFNNIKETLSEIIDDKIKKATQEFEELKSKVKLLGTEISESPIFNTKFKLGLKDGIIEETIDVGMRNIIMHNSRDTEKMKTFFQVLLANALCNVTYGQITVYIYDPNNMGRDLANFYDSDFDNIFKFVRGGEFEGTINELQTFAMNNIKKMQGKKIQEFNTDAIKIGKTPMEYRLLIVLSQPKKLEEDEALQKFMEYSSDTGVMVWCVSDREAPDTKIFKVPFEGVLNPYTSVSHLAPNIISMMRKAKEDSSRSALLWKDFIKKCCPDEYIWKGVTSDRVELYPGFRDGDPDLCVPYTVGNQGDVHIIGVGGTGAGKSVFLNHLVATLTRMYSPRELELWMVDYKGSEFSFYLANEEHPKVLPHVKACLCTSDGDYAGSLYKAIRAETERRFSFLRERGFHNIKEYNATVKDKDPEKIIPRLLFINDEFQVIFEKAEPAVVEIIKKDLTYVAKLGRAAGVHLFFTSQSTKGTISEDTLQQFTLRFALRCDKEVSMQILGTNYASEIKQSNGYLYVRAANDPSLEAQKRFRTPFIAGDVLREHINQMADLAEQQGFPKKDIITYQESDKHDLSEIDQIYASNKNKISEGLIILGERMTYSANRAPDNIILGAANNTHIFSAFTIIEDFINFYRTIRRNLLLQNPEANILVNSQQQDLHYVCEIDKDYPEEIQFMTNEKFSIYKLLEMFEAMLKERVDNKVKDNPVYIILLGWDKAIGFGIDKDMTLANRYATLLQTCGEFNIHFIFICTGIGKIGLNITTACKFRIAGKVDADTSFSIIETKQASKIFEDMKSGYMYINAGEGVRRAKVYRTVIEREIASSELVL